MIKLNIAKGFLIVTDENGQIYPGWLGDTVPIYPELPEPALVYQKCVDRGLSPERIIDVLCKAFIDHLGFGIQFLYHVIL